MHAATLGRELRVNEVIIPTHPAVFSAWGMLMADLRKDYIRTMVVRTDKVDPALLDRMYTQMEVQALDEMRHEQQPAERNAVHRQGQPKRHVRCRSAYASLPPCGGGMGRGVFV